MKSTNPRFRPATLGAAAGRIFLAWTVVLAQSGPVHAHNRNVHAKMTDVAYEIMVAVAHQQNGGSVDPGLTTLLARLAQTVPGMAQFFQDISKAVPRLQKLPSALPDKSAPCTDQPTIDAVGSSQPNWQVGNFGSLSNVPMNHLLFPITVDFADTTTDCEIDAGWKPGGGGVFNISNSGGLTTRDHTGNILGFWAQHPDEEADDWHVFSPFAAAINSVKTITEAGLAAGSTALVSVGCIFACILAPLACQVCVSQTTQLAENVIEGVSNVPDLSDWTNSSLFTGLGHHIDMKPLPAGIPAFDDRHGFFGDDPGPFDTRDSFETLLTALFDGLEIRVKFDPSLGPKNYEIAVPGVGDFDPNTVHRGLSDWESQTLFHTQFTPVDNLAMFGWQQFEALEGVGSFSAPGVAITPSQAAMRLGWPLHAIGDATVPMHVTNTAGWGHRPYEDAVEQLMLAAGNPPLLGDEDTTGNFDAGTQVSAIGAILVRALGFRNMILNWRVAHAAVGNEMPVRDLVTAVAAGTFQKSMAQANTIFNSNASLAYMVAGDSVTSQFETPVLRAVYRDLMLDGIAAELTFLTSAMEVMP